MDEPEGGRKVKRGEGAPLPGPRHLGWQPHLGFRRLLSKWGKEGLFFTWARDNRCFVRLWKGCHWGSRKGCLKRNKTKDPSSQGVGWQQWAANWGWTDVEMRMIY